MLGFEKMETPQSFGDFNVTWLRLPPIYQLHVVERDPKSRLPESPFVVPSDAKYVTADHVSPMSLLLLNRVWGIY